MLGYHLLIDNNNNNKVATISLTLFTNSIDAPFSSFTL